ncbi:MAG: hypothetical protein MRERV_25c036 [Mycoplasmataceae bacterium RV_VA103A]|nr:MAG: hypothetical protein MRERV_25c036 [Mycoplasmataceae bacterium RV_VA103A]
MKVCLECKDKDKKDNNYNNSPPSHSQDNPSTWQYERYCEKCDRWLDIHGVDYEVKTPCPLCHGVDECNEGIHERWKAQSFTPSSFSNSYMKCKGCGGTETLHHSYSTYWEYCGYCHKRTTSQETYDKAKPNWKKRFVISHGESEELFGKPTINHDCLIKCKNNQGGKACGKDWKITADNYWLLIANNFSFFTNNACPSCRLEELEEQIIKFKKNGQELTDEGKEYLAELKKLVSGGSSGGSSNAPNSNGVLPSNPFPTALNQNPLKAAENKKKELKVIIANLEATSDKTPTQETQLTNKKQELKDIEELEIIIKYFLENSIKRIIIEDEKLIIEYSNGTKKTVGVDTNQLKIIRDRMRKVNKKSLLASELGLDYASNPSNQKENKGTNYTPWIIGGSIIGGIALVGGIIFLLTRSRKKAM